MGKEGGVQRDGLGQGDAGDAAGVGYPRSSINTVRQKAQHILFCKY